MLEPTGVLSSSPKDTTGRIRWVHVLVPAVFCEPMLLSVLVFPGRDCSDEFATWI